MEIIRVSSNSEKPMLTMVRMLRRLLRNVLRTTKLLKFMTSSDVAQSFHNVDLRRMVRRHQGAHETDQAGDEHGHDPHARRNLHIVEAEELRRMSGGVNQPIRQANTDQTAR